MSRLRYWLQHAIVDATAPNLDAARADTRRAVAESALAIQQQLAQELALVQAELVDMRREQEQSSARVAEALERMESELDASNAMARALIARVRTLVGTHQDGGRSRVLGGTVDAPADELDLTR